MLEIDGSLKSGSGTIVRYSVSVSALLHKDLHLFNIRKKREKQGLRPQHLKAVEACASLCSGRLEGGNISSQEIFFYPGKKIAGGKFHWDIGTAGSTTMLAQTILPLACYAQDPFFCEIRGGLFQDFAPAAHHLQHVVLPLLKRMGIEAELKVVRPGYVPIGEGIIQIQVQPIKKTIHPINLEDQGNILQIKGIALSSHLEERQVSERMANTCNNILKKHGLHADIECIYDKSAKQRGASLTVYVLTDTGCVLGFDCAGRPRRTSEKIGQRVANMLLEDIKTKATVDRYTADQLIIYAALAEGTSHYKLPKITDHVATNLWLIEKILGAKVDIKNHDLLIHGIGLKKT